MRLATICIWFPTETKSMCEPQIAWLVVRWFDQYLSKHFASYKPCEFRINICFLYVVIDLDDVCILLKNKESHRNSCKSIGRFLCFLSYKELCYEMNKNSHRAGAFLNQREPDG